MFEGSGPKRSTDYHGDAACRDFGAFNMWQAVTVLYAGFLVLPQGLNDPEKGLWSIYHIGIIVGFGIRPEWGSSGPYKVEE